MNALGNLENFINDVDTRTSPIVKAGLIHVQFETIHPFLDGNGRMGRLLITFLLCAEGALSKPFLYLSLYFKEHRADYYDALQRVRSDGDWEGWMRFYLIGVAHTAQQATRTAQALLTLFAADRERVLQLGRSATSAIRVYEHLQQRVIASIPRTAEALNLSVPTVTAALGRLVELRIAREITGKSYARQYVYDRQLKLLNQGDEETSTGAA